MKSDDSSCKPNKAGAGGSHREATHNISQAADSSGGATLDGTAASLEAASASPPPPQRGFIGRYEQRVNAAGDVFFVQAGDQGDGSSDAVRSESEQSLHAGGLQSLSGGSEQDSKSGPLRNVSTGAQEDAGRGDVQTAGSGAAQNGGTGTERMLSAGVAQKNDTGPTLTAGAEGKLLGFLAVDDRDSAHKSRRLAREKTNEGPQWEQQLPVLRRHRVAG